MAVVLKLHLGRARQRWNVRGPSHDYEEFALVEVKAAATPPPPPTLHSRYDSSILPDLYRAGTGEAD